MIDRFLVCAGILNMDQELDDETRGLLVYHAEAFLRAGGNLSLSDWEVLSEESRASFVAAGNAIERERAYMVSVMMRSRLDAMHVMAQDDDGEELVGSHLHAAMDAAEDKLRSRKPIKL